MSRSYDEWLADAAMRRASAGMTRRLTYRDATDTAIDLASNDYLGLASDPRVIAAAGGALETWGAGSTGSRLVTGSTTLHRELEGALTRFVGGEDALVFSSGYTANLGLITALGGPDSVVVSDAHNHASIIDACRLSRARVAVTRHRDIAAVDKALVERSEARALVVVDAVFSTDGDVADVAALHDVCRANDALLVIDEAHSIGVVGRAGRGVADDAGLRNEPDVVRTVTLSKALGSQGGAVVGAQAVIDHLVNTARTFIFDTGLAPASAAAALAALEIVTAEPERIATLQGHRDEIARALGVTAPDGAVVSLVLGDAAMTVAAAAACREAGVLVGCFRPPSVPADGSRLRLTARATLSDVAVKEAMAVVTEIVERLR